MHHFPKNIGDWMTATAHLSEVEECIYSRMVDQYYVREKPLPQDVASICRLVRATSAAAKKAVAVVLAEFFTLESDGYHQKRCDEELEKFHAGDDERAAKEANEAERMRRFRERRKELFDALREVGIVPEYNVKMAELQRLHERYCNAPATRTETPPERHMNGTATTIQNQEPEPEPVQVQNLTTLSGKPDESPPVVDEKINGFHKQAVEILEYLNTSTGRNYRPVETNLKLIVARLKSGMTPLQLREIVFDRCQKWGGDPKMAEYLRPATLFNATKGEQYLGEIA